MSFRPLHDRVVIRRITALEKSTGGIIIPDTVKEKPMEGEIVAAGPGARMSRARSWHSRSRPVIACCSASGRARKSS